MAGGVEVGVESKVRKRNGKIEKLMENIIIKARKETFLLFFRRNESKIYFF